MAPKGNSRAECDAGARAMLWTIEELASANVDESVLTSLLSAFAKTARSGEAFHERFRAHFRLRRARRALETSKMTLRDAIRALEACSAACYSANERVLELSSPATLRYLEQCFAVTVDALAEEGRKPKSTKSSVEKLHEELYVTLARGTGLTRSQFIMSTEYEEARPTWRPKNAQGVLGAVDAMLDEVRGEKTSLAVLQEDMVASRPREQPTSPVREEPRAKTTSPKRAWGDVGRAEPRKRRAVATAADKPLPSRAAPITTPPMKSPKPRVADENVPPAPPSAGKSPLSPVEKLRSTFGSIGAVVSRAMSWSRRFSLDTPPKRQAEEEGEGEEEDEEEEEEEIMPTQVIDGREMHVDDVPLTQLHIPASDDDDDDDDIETHGTPGVRHARTPPRANIHHPGPVNKLRRPKITWRQQEINALKKGVKKHGKGKWALIHSDYHHVFNILGRTQVDLKDKWRNLEKSGSVGS